MQYIDNNKANEQFELPCHIHSHSGALRFKKVEPMSGIILTRGVNSAKYEVGEKVLCFEPDPTKVKVLYDAKVGYFDVSVL